MLIKYIPVEGGHQVQVLLRKVFLYIFILDWGLPPVYELHFLRDNILSPMGAIKDPGVIVIVCLYPVVQFLCRI